MTEETETQSAPPTRRVSSAVAMNRFIWGMVKPFLLVAGGAVALLYLLRQSGI
ncbi:hypothetical protein [Magnetospirillum molischianum]|uniref:hypothetical protein n=1 Tax=Magnetospirillum molischianum TaxID=1083 RepID=UPI0002F817D2|nr:hypothetical protein [Magnetospirillum molischianum]